MLLLPSLKGVSYVILLDVINFLEATVYFIMLPDQEWLLVATVLLRTLLLLALSFEYGVILFDVKSPQAARLHRRASIALLVCVAVSLCALIYPLGQAYVSSRHAEEHGIVTGAALTIQSSPGIPAPSDTSMALDGFLPLAEQPGTEKPYPWLGKHAGETESSHFICKERQRHHADQAH